MTRDETRQEMLVERRVTYSLEIEGHLLLIEKCRRESMSTRVNSSSHLKPWDNFSE